MTTAAPECVLPARGSRPFIVVSDVHLGAVPSSTEDAFLSFLADVARDASGLVIAGDLFDLWYAPDAFVPRCYVRVLARIGDLVSHGVPVCFIAGNRDIATWGGDVLERDLGVRVLHDPTRIRLGARDAVVAHGDGVRKGGIGAYEKPTAVLRHPAVVWAARHLLPSSWMFGLLAQRSGTRVWLARLARGASTGPKARAPWIEIWARRVLHEDPSLGLVICGHSHLPALAEVSPGHFYANAGDWVSHFSYVLIPPDEGAPTVHQWPSGSLIDWSMLDDGTARVAQPSGC